MYPSYPTHPSFYATFHDEKRNLNLALVSLFIQIQVLLSHTHSLSYIHTHTQLTKIPPKAQFRLESILSLSTSLLSLSRSFFFIPLPFTHSLSPSLASKIIVNTISPKLSLLKMFFFRKWSRLFSLVLSAKCEGVILFIYLL